MDILGGIILAAGLSSRMGEYKPLMDIEGRSMISRVVDMMRQAGANEIVVVTGYRREELEAHLAGAHVAFAYNKDFANTQQLESLRIGLSTLKGRCQRIMISPADVPLVHPETVKELINLEGDFLRPIFDGKPGHPVFLEEKWIPYLMEYDGPDGLKGAIERSGCKLMDLEVEDKGVVLDADTKEDFEQLLSWHKNQKK